jgi:phenylalanyl-tRNA synthetase beta chain
VGIVFYDKNASPFMELLNLVTDLFANLGISSRIQEPDGKHPNPMIPENWIGIHPGEFLDIKVMGKTCGFIGSIHPLMARNFKIKGNAVMALIDITDFMDREIADRTKYQPLPKYPGSTFDCTVTTDPRTPVAEVVNAAGKAGIRQMVDLRVADVYAPADGPKAVTLRAFFLDRERTLSPEFISEAEQKLIDTLTAAGYPLKQ